MSGLELVIIVGAGIFITKKVQERKKQKKIRELQAAGLLVPTTTTTTTPGLHGQPQLVAASQQRELLQQRQRQQQNNQQQVPPVEEESLPMYEPPAAATKTQSQGMAVGDEKVYLPSYDEAQTSGATARQTAGRGADGVGLNYGRTPLQTTSFTNIDPTLTGSQSRSQRWKIWKKNGPKEAAAA